MESEARHSGSFAERPRTGSFVGSSGNVTCRCYYVYTTSRPKLMYEVAFSMGIQSFSLPRSTEEFQGFHTQLKRNFRNIMPQHLRKFPAKLFGGPQQTEKRASFLAQLFHFITENEALFEWPLVRDFIHPHISLLKLSVLAGRNLTVRDRNGLSDTFCRVAAYDAKKRAGKPYQTPIIKKTLNPVWQSPEMIIIEFDRRTDVTGVTVSCWDHNVVASNAFMGRLTIPFQTIPENKKIVRWFPLHHTKKHSSGDIHGEIKLELCLCNDGESPPDMPTLSNPSESMSEIVIKRAQSDERKRRREKKERDRFAGHLHIQYLYNPPAGAWEGYLTIKVVNAKSLATPQGQKLPDPYIVLSLGAVRVRSRVRKNSDSPEWNEIHYFYIPSVRTHETKSLQIDVYDWNRIEKSLFIGDTSLLIEELVPHKVQDFWAVICGPPLTEKEVSKKLGRRLAEQGYTPNLPIVLVPGFASSGLFVVEGHKPWVGDRVWLSLNKIMAQNARKRFDVGRSKKCYDTIDFANKNLWIKHICLDAEDCKSDPPHIKVRGIQGKEAVTYLDPGLLTGSLSYVMGPLVENLYELGYNDDNLICAPYDWRVPLYYLEERDGYFSSLKVKIEAMVRRERKKAVILGHSMGNRTIQYFLNWVKLQPGGQSWIDHNIHTFVAVGAPFLGSPKSVRGLISGDRFGMDLLLSNREAKGFARTLGSIPSLMPIGEFDDHDVGLVYTTRLLGRPPEKVAYRDFLKEIGGAKTIELLDNEYVRDPCFGGGYSEEANWPILSPPPVQRLFAIYGVNLETERLYFFKPGKDPRDWVLDHNPCIDPKDRTWSQFVIKKGTVYETTSTPQPSMEKWTGVRTFCSGDGTVPYASLSFCQTWKGSIKEVLVEELEGVEHREILNNRLFFKKLIDFIGDAPPVIKSPVHLTLRGKNYYQQYQEDILEDVEEEGEESASGGDESATSAPEASGSLRVVGDDFDDDVDYDDGAIQEGGMI